MLRSASTGRFLSEYGPQEDKQKGIRAYVAAVIHSKSLSEIEMLPYAMLVVDHSRNGYIIALEDVDHLPDVEILSLAQKYNAEDVLMMPGRIIIPGFIDTHAHAPQYAFTGTGMHLPLLKWSVPTVILLHHHYTF